MRKQCQRHKEIRTFKIRKYLNPFTVHVINVIKYCDLQKLSFAVRLQKRNKNFISCKKQKCGNKIKDKLPISESLMTLKCIDKTNKSLMRAKKCLN